MRFGGKGGFGDENLSLKNTRLKRKSILGCHSKEVEIEE